MLFITGIEGFVGKELEKMCRETNRRFLGVDLPWDVRDPDLVESLIPEDAVVIHLAALSTDKLCEADPLEALDVNVAGTINVTRAALKRKCRQFVFASTEKVYPEGTGGQEFQTENDEVRPHSLYARSKLMGEQILAASGIPNVTVLRFGLAYGCRDTNWCAVENITADVMRDGNDTITVGCCDTARRYVHVRDLCAGILAAVGRTGHETFNLPGSALITMDKIIGAATGIVNKAVYVKSLRARPSVRNTDGTKAREVLGWVPKVPFPEGMREVVEYFKGRKR